MNKLIVWVLAIIGIAAGVYYVLARADSLPFLAGSTCTAEVLLCPDGTTVSRRGPNCEFAPCAGGTGDNGSVRLSAGMNQGVSAFNVQIFPLEVVEDSRCAEGVQCIQAGTVRIRALVVSAMGRSTMTLQMGQKATTEAEEIMLAEVLPRPRAGTPIEPGEYRFIIEIAKRPVSDIAPQ